MAEQFVLGTSLPVFARGDAPGFDALVNEFEHGSESGVYLYAAALGHEVIHVMTGSTNEEQPLIGQLILTRRFVKEGRISRLRGDSIRSTIQALLGRLTSPFGRRDATSLVQAASSAPNQPSQKTDPSEPTKHPTPAEPRP